MPTKSLDVMFPVCAGIEIESEDILGPALMFPVCAGIEMTARSMLARSTYVSRVCGN